MPHAFRRVLNVLLPVLLLIASTARAGEPLPTDPALVKGELDNGLRYVVRKHSIPAGRATIWVHIHSGSMNESDRQRGIAHYLEHMAFNGSENFAPGTLVPFFQSLGMTFGRDQNAFTSFDQTTYQLSLPNTQPETLKQGMTFFADVIGRLSLLPKEIESERQIIQEERRRSLSGNQRVSYYVLERLTPGSPFGFRLPIGSEKTIAEVNEADFRDYYKRWYGPGNSTLIVVADEDPEKIIAAIKEHFGTLPKSGRPTPNDMKIKAYDHSFGIVASDPEIRGATVEIVFNKPAEGPNLTVEAWRDDLALSMAERAMNQRFRDAADKPQAPFNSASVSSGDQAGVLHSVSLSTRSNPGKWKEALEASAMELQRARAFGFTQKELDEQKKNTITGAERAVDTEDTSAASSFVSRINNAITTGSAMMSPKQRLELLNKVLPEITLDEVNLKFAEKYDFKHAAFVARMPSSAELPSEGELVELGAKALSVTPTKPEEKTATAATELMSSPPAPGSIAGIEEHKESGVWSGWLSNNVRVHYKFMDQQKDNVSINISLIGGEMLETAATRGITSAAQLAWSRPATKHLASTDIREMMNDKKVTVRGGGGGGGGGRRGGGGGGGGAATGDAISLNISGKPAELETGFQLAYLLLTEPRIESAAFTQWQTRLRETLGEEVLSPDRAGARLVTQAIYPDNEARTRPLTVENVDALSLDAAQARLDQLIKESPIEMTIVGDIDKDKALELAAKYIGALPAREKIDPKLFADRRKLQRPTGPRVFEKTVETPTEKAFVMCGFYGADESNRPDVRALSMAARLLSTRMVKQVREEAQLVYSIGASSRAAGTYPGFGVFSAQAPTDPEKADALVKKLQSMYEEFAGNGPTEDEMVVARKQFANNYEQQLKEPGFWFGRLNQLTWRGFNMDDLMKEPQAYQDLTAEQVKNVFAKYYSKDSSIVVVVKPKNGDPAPKKTARSDQ